MAEQVSRLGRGWGSISQLGEEPCEQRGAHPRQICLQAKVTKLGNFKTGVSAGVDRAEWRKIHVYVQRKAVIGAPLAHA